MDKAAVLAYCAIQNKDGQWVGCECCFTIVYDVMVVCTSIYKRSMQSESESTDNERIRVEIDNCGRACRRGTRS